jgi:hypothetical protein
MKNNIKEVHINRMKFFHFNKRVMFLGLFKNVQMQGAQKADREAYMNIR